jgi:DNA-binding response OmpR family regulator
MIILRKTMAAASKKRAALIVDDEECIRECVGYALRKNGFAVENAENGKVALEKIARNKPDIIILDFAMPQMDGLQVCKQLKRYPDTQNIPIIFLSAHKHIEQMIKDMPGAAVKYLEKPYDLKYLLEQIESLL